MVVSTAAPPPSPLPTSPAPPLRGISPVAARPISHRPASALRSSSLLSPPHAVPSRPTIPDGASPLLDVPVPGMDPAQDEVADVVPRPPERDFAGTAYVPVYVMLPYIHYSL